MKKKPVQGSICCPCGSTNLFALGLCETCYRMKRQDAKDFGGLRERVLERDGYLCRVCAELPEVNRLCVGQPPSVHHRVPGVSKLHLMITLCAAHHAQVEHLEVATKTMTSLFRLLWREQHPDASEQAMLDFRVTKDAAVPTEVRWRPAQPPAREWRSPQ